MIRARIRNNRIPNDRLVRKLTRLRCCRSSVRPRRRYVDEELLGVPVEERGEVGGESEPDDGVFFFFSRIVVWAAFDSVREQVVSRNFRNLLGLKGSGGGEGEEERG